MKNPREALADARIRVMQCRNALNEALRQEREAEVAVAEARQAERAPTLRPPPVPPNPQKKYKDWDTFEHENCPGPIEDGHCMCGWVL